jgi:exosortase/archaeosortase family protein
MRKGLWESLEGRIRPRKLSKRQERQWDLLMFLVRLIILAAPLYALLSVPGVLYSAQISTTNATALVLNALGMHASTDGPSVTIADPNSPFRFIISEDCTGWKSVMFLFALIFAVKGPKLRNRLVGLGFGVVVIFAGNMARIIATVLAERALGLQAAMLLHDWLFRLGLVVLVLGLWAFWLVYLNKKLK